MPSKKKSNFTAVTSVPSDASFDFTSNGQNLRILKGDFYTDIGVTGSLESIGSGTGTTVLVDAGGGDYKIRNLESGDGVNVSVSAEQGALLEIDLDSGADGVPVLQGNNFIRSIKSGPGISVSADNGAIQISAGVESSQNCSGVDA